MKLFFVGIGGIGTSALAQLCAQRGDEVTGSNLGKTAIWPPLEEAGITLFDTHDASQLSEDTDVLIYSEAVPEDNPERVKAKELNIPQKSYFEYLGEVSQDYRVIAVTGTHGKTTTTAMLAAGMIEAHFSATMIVGSKLKEFKGSNFKAGNNEWLIVEACEYRNNFQYLDPEIIVLTNLELDHVDYYEDQEHYYQTFRDFCKKGRTIICHKGDTEVETMLEPLENDVLWVDVEGFTLPLDLPGLHNRQNASLALAAAEEIQGLQRKKFKKGLKHYQGAWRRLELIGENIYDDYGHHPTEITATLQALRERHTEGEVYLIYEPHQYSRTKEFFSEFLESFKSADHIGLYPIYAARDSEEDKAAISRQHFIEVDPRIKRIDDLAEVHLLVENRQPEDVLIFMGAGNISKLAHQYVAE